MNERTRAMNICDALGAAFGTEDFSIFLYSLVKLQRVRNIVELGTGFGVSAFLMALAAKDQGGHVWTIDDGALLRDENVLKKAIAAVREAGLETLSASSPREYWDAIAASLGIASAATFLEQRMDLLEKDHFAKYPFASSPIDLLWADFGGGSPDHTLRILAHFLPMMSSASSMFIDSLPTVWPSYLVMERTVELLSSGRVPAVLQSLTSVDLEPIVRSRRFTLVHITKPGKMLQGGTAWLKIEPVDLFPHPRTQMFGAQTLQRYGVEDQGREVKAANALHSATHAFQLTVAVREWVSTPHAELGDKTPMEAIKAADGPARVRELVTADAYSEYPQAIAEAVIKKVLETLGIAPSA